MTTGSGVTAEAAMARTRRLRLAAFPFAVQRDAEIGALPQFPRLPEGKAPSWNTACQSSPLACGQPPGHRTLTRNDPLTGPPDPHPKRRNFGRYHPCWMMSALWSETDRVMCARPFILVAK